MKTENQKLKEILTNNNLHGLLELITYTKSNIRRSDNTIGETIITLIASNDNSSVKDLAAECNESNNNPTFDNAKLLFNEIADNLSYYLNAMDSFNDSCKDDALDVLKELYPNDSDEQLRTYIA